MWGTYFIIFVSEILYWPSCMPPGDIEQPPLFSPIWPDAKTATSCPWNFLKVVIECEDCVLVDTDRLVLVLPILNPAE